MPVYRNDSTTNYKSVTDSNGIYKRLAPGEQTATNKYYDDSDLTKISDIPYLNIVDAYTIETFTAAETHDVTLSSSSIAKIRIMKADGDFDIFLQSESNTPAILKNWTDTDQPIDIIINGLCDTIAIKSNNTSGSIHIVEINTL